MERAFTDGVDIRHFPGEGDSMGWAQDTVKRQASDYDQNPGVYED